MDLISVIIPVYNVQKYLNRCIESVCNQTYSNLEIIIVNDGSTDKSGAICEDYTKDSRVMLIHKRNGGLSDARNAGLKVAKGKYVTFVDSDDFVAKDYILNLYNCIKQVDVDIAVSGIQKFENENEIAKSCLEPKTIKYSSKAAIVDMFYQKSIGNSASAKMYPTNYFQKVKFPVGKLYEDLATVYLLFEQAKIVGVIEVNDYFYYQRTDSIMNRQFDERNLDRIDISNEILEHFKEKDCELEQAARSRLFISAVQVLRELPYKDERYIQSKEVIQQIIHDHRACVLGNNQVKKINRIIALATFLPISWLQGLGVLYKMRYR